MTTPQSVWSALLGLSLCSGVARADDAGPDWWEIQKDVTSILIKPDASLANLAQEVCKTPPTDARMALRKFSVVTRAGMTAESIEALRQLKQLYPQLGNHQISSIYYDACDHHLDWEVAEAIVTIFADDLSELALENRLLRHFIDAGWSLERIDKWLADKPAGKNNFWIKARLNFNVSHGRGDALLKELEQAVRTRPQEIAGVIAFLEAVSQSGFDRKKLPDFTWIAESVKPELSSDAHEIASLLVNAGALETAIPFFLKAINTPLNDEEIRKMSSMIQVMIQPEMLRKMVAAQLREELARCLLDLKRADEAQKWMVEAENLRKDNNLGSHPHFAGQVQAASGQRVIESRIIAKEEISKDDPQYWLERAEYYQGRTEAAPEEEALLKALALATPKDKPQHPGKGFSDERSRILLHYARFLARQKRESEAVALLRKEISDAPATAVCSEQAARMLAFDFEKLVKVDDPVLWTWLDNRPIWSHTEERLLWRMLENSPKETLDREFTRAEKLTTGQDASRAAILGWIENRMHYAKRSVPLLEEAARNAKNDDLRKRVSFTLLESYLDTQDWKNAERIFPVATNQLTSYELPEWYGRVALAAAKAGAHDDAMRIWQRITNLDLSCLKSLDDLAKAGLKAKLISFYQTTAKAIPTSRIPTAAIAILEKADGR
ncbi:MAG: hypothetical protein H8M99_06765 [Gloeobacteraceae cyanobacterium ES-bin-144]|nr:hypothetical protein [Verrucomicrobiales bacterium]